jgi:membrane associated rhomboid family serine protease
VLPLRDRNPSPTTPYVVYGLIALNAAAFLFELGLEQEALRDFVQRFGLVPQRATAALRGEAGMLGALLVPAITSMFLHGGWTHLLGNMWFLHIFGDNVEDRLGHGLFVAFYLACGLFASASQYVLDPDSTVPIVGASGAIAGVLGAYAVRWPHARVLTLVPLFVIFTFIELPALIVLGMWFLLQFLQGAASIGVQFTHGVAYWAHVGGFVAGAALIYPLMAVTPHRKRHR